MKQNTILQGDALTKLKELPEKSINMCMTSPPYWALRDYGTATWEGGKGDCDHKIPEGEKDPKNKNNSSHNVRFIQENCYKCGAKRIDQQLGLEPTFDQYISNLCDIFDEVKRVLRDDGTCWVNLGDTYNAGRSGGHAGGTKGLDRPENAPKQSGVNAKELPTKSLVMIPFRFAIEMVNRDWILRNTIIWHKRNCMPTSAKDRFTVDFEYIFFFSKKKKYYFEQQLDKALHKEDPRARYGRLHYRGKRQGEKGTGQENFVKIVDERNKRAVWTINPKPFKEAHFATYPEELCETPIKAGCPEFVCMKCGNPKFPFYTPSKEYEELLKSQRKTEAYTSEGREEAIKIGNAFGIKKVSAYPDYKTSFEPTCSCNAEFTGGIVLDPFFGSGTTGVVALKQNKKFIGIELNKEYIGIAKKRLKPHLEQRKLT